MAAHKYVDKESTKWSNLREYFKIGYKHCEEGEDSALENKARPSLAEQGQKPKI